VQHGCRARQSLGGRVTGVARLDWVFELLLPRRRAAARGLASGGQRPEGRPRGDLRGWRRGRLGSSPPASELRVVVSFDNT
jgi:hypothetical protein